MIDYKIKDEKSFDPSIKNIKQNDGKDWVPTEAENHLDMTLIYSRCRVICIKIICVRVPRMICTFYDNNEQVYQFTEDPKNWSDDRVLVQRQQLRIESSNEVRIQLINTKDAQLRMGIRFIGLYKDKGDTPVKVRPQNLSPVQEFKAGARLQGASKSPYNHSLTHSVFKDRIKQLQKESSSFQVKHISSFKPASSLKDAVLNKKLNYQSEQDQLQKAMKLSKQTEQQDRMKRQLMQIEEQQTINIQQNTIGLQSQRPDKIKHIINLSIVDKRQLALLGRLSKQYKILQQAEEKQQQVPINDRISNLIVRTIFNGQTFVMSGFIDKQRVQVVQKAKKIGLKYSHEVVDNCFVVSSSDNTPKALETKKFKNALVVTKAYINDCFDKKERLPVERYLRKVP